MAPQITDHVVSPMLDQSPDEIDSKSQLRHKMRALNTQRRSLGKLETFDRDVATSQLSALVIGRDIFSNNLTSVPTKRVKRINSDSVILDLSATAVKKLPQLPAN